MAWQVVAEAVGGNERLGHWVLWLCRRGPSPERLRLGDMLWCRLVDEVSALLVVDQPPPVMPEVLSGQVACLLEAESLTLDLARRAETLMPWIVTQVSILEQLVLPRVGCGDAGDPQEVSLLQGLWPESYQVRLDGLTRDGRSWWWRSAWENHDGLWGWVQSTQAYGLAESSRAAFVQVVPVRHGQVRFRVVALTRAWIDSDAVACLADRLLSQWHGPDGAEYAVVTEVWQAHWLLRTHYKPEP